MGGHAHPFDRGPGIPHAAGRSNGSTPTIPRGWVSGSRCPAASPGRWAPPPSPRTPPAAGSPWCSVPDRRGRRSRLAGCRGAHRRVLTGYRPTEAQPGRQALIERFPRSEVCCHGPPAGDADRRSSVEVGVGIRLGVRDGRRRTRFAHGRPYWAAPHRGLRRPSGRRLRGGLPGRDAAADVAPIRAGGLQRHERTRPKSAAEVVYAAPDPLARIRPSGRPTGGRAATSAGTAGATTSAPSPAAGCWSWDRPGPANPPG